MRIITLSVSTENEKDARAYYEDLFRESQKYQETGECFISLSSSTTTIEDSELILRDPTLEKVREILERVGDISEIVAGEIIFALLINNIVFKTREVDS